MLTPLMIPITEPAPVLGSSGVGVTGVSVHLGSSKFSSGLVGHGLQFGSSIGKLGLVGQATGTSANDTVWVQFTPDTVTSLPSTLPVTLATILKSP